MSALTLISLARRFWPYLAGALVIAALVFAVIRYGNNREREGAEGERVKWQAEAAKQAAIALTLAQERQSAVDRAETAEASAQRSVELLAVKGRDTVKEYYRANPADNRDCISPDRLRAIAASDTATYAAASATGKRADTMRNPPD